jgi:hypothetical protein
MRKLRDQAGRDIDAWIASDTGGRLANRSISGFALANGPSQMQHTRAFQASSPNDFQGSARRPLFLSADRNRATL